jgi:LysM repeat protein
MIGRHIFWGVGLVVVSILLGFHAIGLAGERYTVKPGDSLSKISKSFGVTTEALKRVNGLKEERIKPKQVLLIPAQDERQTRQPLKGHR